MAVMVFAIGVLTIALLFIIWYIFVASCLFRCLSKSPTFILLFSQAVNDIYGLTQSAWQPILRIAGISEENYLPDRWLSVIHGSFELVSLPHYIFIALNRALFLIDHTKMSTVFSTRKTTVLCIFMWIVPIVINIMLHIFASEDDDGFYLFGSDDLEMGSSSSGVDFDSYLSAIFDISFYLTVVAVVIIYVVAIVWHSYKRRALTVTVNFVSTASSSLPSFGMEMRLTLVCLVNLLPPTINTILDFTWANRSAVGSFIYAIFTLFDNCINSIILPMFSKMLRDCIKKRLMAAVGCWRKDNKIGQTTMFDLRSSRPTTVTTISAISAISAMNSRR